LCFLVGGQLLAIAAIRIWNRPELQWVYDAFPVTVLLYLGRFGWLALVGARGTWGKGHGGWEELRAMAAVDGAGPVRTAMYVIWPIAWPMLLAGALLAGALSLTEVPATVLLQPSNPQVLTPMLMTWVHMTRYDPMIEASLLMMASVIVPWCVVVVLAAIARRR
jgi:ABC-type Fe3+ transport system permease subunit